jgi:hypothetical protein
MTESEPASYHLLEVTHFREEAERSAREWVARAEELPGAELRIDGWRHPERGEEFLIRTNSFQLFKKREQWLPRPKVFQIEDLADPGELRSGTWTKRLWRDRPALMSKDRRSAREYTRGETFNPEIWDLVPDAWDHEHCGVCMDHICNHPDCGFQEAYYSGDEETGGWICPPCYGRLIEGWEPIR